MTMIQHIKKELTPLYQKLNSHHIYKKVDDNNKLQIFMENHVYSVWDFMSLVKFLQNHFAPSAPPWKPREHKDIIHFINDIVLEEESDHLPDGRTMSHFEMYCLAMAEVGANSDKPFSFVQNITSTNLQEQMNSFDLPLEIQAGVQKTFGFLNSHKPHIAAAAFCFGRENMIPNMFRELLNKMNISKEQAPLFHFYLSRHIELDGEIHGPMALKMVEILCADDKQRWEEALTTAQDSIQSRINLWNYIESIL